MGFTMRAWPVARSIFDAPLERSERADNKLDKWDRIFLGVRVRVRVMG